MALHCLAVRLSSRVYRPEGDVLAQSLVVPSSSEQSPVGTFEAFRATKVFPSLDGLRCLSILGVIWFHVIPKQTGLVGAGFLGVDLFFAISGFLITTLLVRE